MTIRKSIERVKATVEATFDWLFAGLLGCIYYHLISPNFTGRNMSELFQAALNVAAIGVGFLVSAKAILLSISNSKVIRKLKGDAPKLRTNSFRRLIDFFISAIWWSSATALLSASYLWIDFSTLPLGAGCDYMLLLWFFIAGGAMGAAFRVVWLFSKLVQTVASE